MEIIQAIILGIVQGLTEFLPVSSSGHLEIGHALFGLNNNNLLFDIVLHGGTVLSTIVVFRKEIAELFSGFFKIKYNEPTKYSLKLLLSAIPAAIAGILFESKIELLFVGNVALVGSMLLLTALVLTFANFYKTGERKITYLDSIIIGIAQMIAIIPGISRSGSTIATGMILGIDKKDIAKFSFLMVIIPILGANLLKIVSGDFQSSESVNVLPFIVGFIAAFISGLFACKWMISIVKRGKLIYFAVYCFILGLIAIFAA